MQSAVVSSIKAIKAGLSLDGELTWKAKPTTAEFQVSLRNNMGRPLRVIGQQAYSKPHTIVFLITDATDRSANIYRLCVRGKHVNRSSDGKRWLPGSHLHEWTREHRCEHAQDPWRPWPLGQWSDTAMQPLSSEQMRDLFDVFCGMLGISCNVETFWVDPPSLEERKFITLVDGEEVP